MKVKTISRDVSFVGRGSATSISFQRNLDPSLHPHEVPREYTKALNSAKLQRMFAKPFIASLSGHFDSVSKIATHPKSLSCVISGACDGEIKIWNLTTHSSKWGFRAHTGFVRGITTTPDGLHILSCGDDKAIRSWKLDYANYSYPEETGSDGNGNDNKPFTTFMCDTILTDIDYSKSGDYFATSGANSVHLWDFNRSEPVHSIQWGVDSVLKVRWNPVETEIFASCMSDRAIILYDSRAASAASKVYLNQKTNSISWNPQEPSKFSVANDDNNCYTFDMRFLKSAIMVHKDHAAAVMDIDYAPTGNEFVTGSYDNTIRIFPNNDRRSREVYHTKRMQKVLTVKYTSDSRFVLSGSDETNIRIWKSNASQRLQPLGFAQKRKAEYENKLIDKFSHLQEIRKVIRHRHLPRKLYTAAKVTKIIEAGKERKELHRSYSNPSSKPKKSEKEKSVVLTE
eukprot:TRINITY_DN2287_c0_g1_i1.p1 TRINITY_DN2287_c0_g1~~TRINITY_DN2287_c0_g1_i1.p1  ORF type:complete len:474 (+),score=88.38 TRINITY_DN2287_c0_g1_i1:60-1424(+)